MTKHKLSDITGSRPHQNVVLKSSKIDYLNVRNMDEIYTSLEMDTKKPGQFFLMLDGITDPQNFGSILRSTIFLGVDGIIVNTKDACGLTPAVSKVSSGALEFLPLFSVKFVGKFLEDVKSQKHNFRIISTNIDEDSIEQVKEEDEMNESINQDQDADLKNYKRFADKDLPQVESTKGILSLKDLDLSRDENIIVVLGSEGKGVSRTISKLADDRVYIPPKLDSSMTGKYPFNMIDSLNVGVSAALMLYHIKNLRL